MKKEIRLAGGTIAAPASTDTAIFRGYAAVFSTEAQIGDWFIEVIDPAAFDEALKRGDDVRALFNHEEDHVLGRTSAGTLRLSVDQRGLACEIDPPDTQLARDLAVLVKRGDVNQMSFGFRVTSERWDDPVDSTSLPRRTILSVELIDVAIVTFPAYGETEVDMRGLNAHRAENPALRAAAQAKTETMRRRIAIAEAVSRSSNPAA